MAKKKQVKKVSSSVKKKEQNKPIDQKLASRYGFNFFKKCLPIFLILVVMLIAFYVRSGPITLSGMDERVESNIYSNIKNLIAQEVNMQYPNLNDFDKQNEVNLRYEKVVETGSYQGYDLEDLVQTSLVQAKESFQADNGQTYLNAIDPYHFMKYTDLYEENGYVGTNIDEDGNVIRNYKLAPVGQKGSYSREFHVALEGFLYDIFGVDEKSTDGEKTRAIFLIPVLVAMLSVIPIFVLLNKYTDNISAFFGSLFLVTIGTYVSRTIAGFVDTDAYNVFFPLLIAMFIVLAILNDNKWLKSAYAVFAGLSQALFLWAWGNGWFLFIFTVVALLGYIGYLKIVNIIKLKKIDIVKIWNSIKDNFIIVGIYLISSYVFTYLILGKDIILNSYYGLTGSVSNLAGISGSNIWPNVLSSVAELNPASFKQIVASVGGNMVFLLAMLGLVFLTIDFKNKYSWSKFGNRLLILGSVIWFLVFMNSSAIIQLTANFKLLFIILLFVPIGVGLVLSLINQNNSNRIFLAILLSIWIAGTIYMSLNGVRFILLLAPAFAIAFGVGLYEIGKIINNFANQEFKPKTFIGKQAFGFVVILIMFGIVFSPMFTQAVSISKNTYPNFDDAWYGAMYKIKNESNSDAIITSWWDFGHFFAAIADRGVTFDGGSQGTPRSHWVGKLLLENDEKVSYDILKMLVCGGNEAFNEFYSYVGNDNSDVVKINKILYSTFGEENKSELLKNNKYYNLTDSQVESIMQYLACEEPVEDFLITSEDMVGKAGVWAHWGSWDFTKKYIHDNYKILSSQEIALNIDENVSLVDRYIGELENIDSVSNAENINREDLVNRWFADYPGYIPLDGRYLFACRNNDNVSLQCENSIEIDVNSLKIINHGFGEQVVFRNLYFPNNQGDLGFVSQNDTGMVDVVLIPSQTGVNVLMAQAPLGGSLFTKLFYLDGMNSNSFVKFEDVYSATGVRVKVWKVNWNVSSQGDAENLDELLN